MARKLGNNPLLNMDPSFDIEAEKKHLKVDAAKVGRKRNENLVREKGAQQGLTEEWTRATFIIKVETLEILKDYAYTERLKLKEVIEMAFDKFIDGIDKDSLLPHR